MFLLYIKSLVVVDRRNRGSKAIRQHRRLDTDRTIIEVSLVLVSRIKKLCAQLRAQSFSACEKLQRSSDAKFSTNNRDRRINVFI